MKTKPMLLACAILFAHAGACGKTREPAATNEPSVPPSPSVQKLEAQKRLALSPPNGATPIDVKIAQTQGVLAKTPKKLDLWIVLGWAWIQKARATSDPGFYLNADACADVVFNEVPGEKMALNLRAQVMLNDHRFEEVEKLAQKIIDADPEDPMSYGTRADALLELGRFEDAAVAVQKMVDLKPNLPSYSRAAHLRWLQGDGKGAREIYKLAIGAGGGPDPEPLAWVLVQTALMFFQEGDYDGAEAGADHALERFPDFPPALVVKGRVASTKGQHAQAVGFLSRAMAKSPLAETAWLLGDAKERAGDAAGAKAAFAEVERLGLAHDGRTLSLFLSTKNRDAKLALSQAEAERKVRGDLYTLDALAWALHRAGRDVEAKAASDLALRLGTKDARLLYHAGAIRIALKELDAGRKLVEEALKLCPEFDATAAPEARALLAAK